MIDRHSLYYYIGLALLCCGLLVGFMVFVKPLLEVRLEPIPKPLTSGKEKPMPIPDSTGPTIDDIHQRYAHGVPGPYQRTQNPFLWADELRPAPTVQAPPPPETVPRLGMIVVGQKHRLVFLDGTGVYEGARYKTFKVEKITPQGVVLSGASGRFELIPPEDRFGPAHVKRLERSRF